MGYINMPELSKDVQDMINKGVEVIPSEVDYTNYPLWRKKLVKKFQQC